MAFALYHNMDMQALDIEAGFLVSHKVAGEGGIEAGEIPAGKYACGTHIGPYDQIEPLYTALKQWAEAQGYQTIGTAYEWYFSTPETPPAEIKTEVWFPLK
jgi:effector-binding domain-containing protein